jgi:hypothetical protein
MKEPTVGASAPSDAHTSLEMCNPTAIGSQIRQNKRLMIAFRYAKP